MIHQILEDLKKDRTIDDLSIQELEDLKIKIDNRLYQLKSSKDNGNKIVK